MCLPLGSSPAFRRCFFARRSLKSQPKSSVKVFFGMAKFLVFDTVAAFIYRQFPWFARSEMSQKPLLNS